MWALRFVGSPSRVPEGRVVAVYGKAGFVAALIAVGAHHLPSTLVDVEVEVICHRCTRQHTFFFTIGSDGAGFLLHKGHGVFLVFAAIDAVVDSRSTCLGRHLDASVSLALATDRLAYGHVHSGDLGFEI